ncbi:MAG: response regulator [Cytophagaceae bacterium]
MKDLNCILLVDDDSINNFINLRLINKLNLSKEVKVAMNGEEGLNFVKEKCEVENGCCPELILLDINMPVMDGIEFLKYFNKLQIDKESVKVVVLTTSSNASDLEKVKKQGVYMYMNKPLTEEKLLKLVENAKVAV